MNVGRDDRGVVERSATNEQHAAASVLAEDRDLARRTAEDLLFAAVVARHGDRSRIARKQVDPLGLDQQVDDEGASRLSLTVEAVTAMREEGVGCKSVADRSA